MSAEVKALVAVGNDAEDRQDFDGAADAYARAVQLIDPIDRELRGRLLMNLGTVFTQAGKPPEAIDHYTQAARCFEGLRGEAVLLRAHAHLNIAGHLVDVNDPEALPHIDTALRWYRAYPFTSQTDIVDAMIVRTLARAYCEQELTEEELRETWEAAQAVRPEDLTMKYVLQLAEIRITASRAGGETPEVVLSSLLDWGSDYPPLQAFLAQL